MIKIVTDSTSDLTPQVAQQYGIEVVPLYVHFGEQTYKDGIDLSNEQFFVKLAASPQLPTTSQPSAGDFLDVYKCLAADGSTILSIHLSSQLSGTYASACAARDMMGGANIHVMDTNIISIYLGWMVVEAARLARAGQPIEMIIERLETMKRSCLLYLTVDTLEYLHKGGRIGGAQAWVGMLLQMKPVLVVKGGRVEPFERIRTRAKAVARLKEIVLESVKDHDRVYLGILHAAALDEAQKLYDELKSEVGNLVETTLVEIGPVISVHVGPGALGVSFLAE